MRHPPNLSACESVFRILRKHGSDRVIDVFNNAGAATLNTVRTLHAEVARLKESFAAEQDRPLREIENCAAFAFSLVKCICRSLLVNDSK